MRFRSIVAVTLVAGPIACVMAVDPAAHNPVPYVERLDPEVLTVSTDGTVVDVVGRGFVEGAEATFNGEPRPTEFDSSSRVRILLRPGDVARAASHAVSVVNPEPGGGASFVRMLHVRNSAPHVDSILPRVIDAFSDAPVTLRVFGHGFIDDGTGSSVVMGEIGVPTHVVSDSELEALVGEHILQHARSWSVRVVNPTPGGGLSGAVSFEVLSPLPVISSVAPDSIRLTESAEVRVSGENFMPGATVWLDTMRYEPFWVDRDSLVFHVPRVTHRGGVIRVENPGGRSSDEVSIGIQETTPVITSTWPLAFEAGGGVQSVRIVGSYFAPDAVVTWNSSDRESVIIDDNTREITVDASEVASVAQGTLRVRNPRGGGLSSGRSMPTVPRGRVVYASSWGNLVVSRLNGMDRVDLPVLGGERADWVESSPSGDELLYTSVSGFREYGGLIRTAPGDEAERVSELAVRWPRLTRDGAWVYFGMDRDLWRMRPDGTDAELVLEAGPDTDLLFPHPSPSGDRLLYSVSGSELRMLDLGTGESTSLGVAAHDALWSPDGTWIAFRDAARRPRIMRPDGTENQPVPNAGEPGAGGFAWSPDARYLLTMHAGALALTDVGTGVVIRIPRPDCGCAWADFPEGWQVSWYLDPTDP